MVLLAVASRAHADEVRLAVDLAPGCPTAEHAAARLSELTEMSVHLAVVLPTVEIAVVTADGGGLIGSAQMPGGMSRTIEAPAGQCGALVDSLLLVVSLAIGPRVPAADPPPPPPATAPAAPPEPESADGRPAIVAPAPARAGRRGRIDLVAGVSASSGTAPDPTFGLLAGARLRHPRWSVGVEARGDLPVTASMPSASIRTQLLSAALVPCLRTGPVGTCLVAAAGMLRGRGVGFDGARSDATPFFGYGGRLSVRAAQLGGVVLRAQVDALAVAGATQARIGDQTVWRTSPLSLTAAISASYTIW